MDLGSEFCGFSVDFCGCHPLNGWIFFGIVDAIDWKHTFSVDFLLIGKCHFLDRWISCGLVNVPNGTNDVCIKLMGNVHILTLWKYLQKLCGDSGEIQQIHRILEKLRIFVGTGDSGLPILTKNPFRGHSCPS